MKYNFETPEDELAVVRSLDLTFLTLQMTNKNLEGIQHNDMLTDLLLKESFSMSLDYDLWRKDIETFLTNIYKNTSPEDLNQEKYQGIVNLVEGHYLPDFEDYIVRNSATAFKNGLMDESEISTRDWIIRFDEDSNAVITAEPNNPTSPQTLVRQKQYMTEVSPELDTLITEMEECQSARTERRNKEAEQKEDSGQEKAPTSPNP